MGFRWCYSDMSEGEQNGEGIWGIWMNKKEEDERKYWKANWKKAIIYKNTCVLGNNMKFYLMYVVGWCLSGMLWLTARISLRDIE